MTFPCDVSERADVTEEVIERAEGGSVISGGVSGLDVTRPNCEDPRPSVFPTTVGVSGLDVTLPSDVSVSAGVPGRDVLGCGVSEGVAGCDVNERADVTEEVIERAGWLGEGGSLNSVGVSGLDVTREPGLDVIFPRDVSVSVGVPGRDVAGEGSSWTASWESCILSPAACSNRDVAS